MIPASVRTQIVKDPNPNLERIVIESDESVLVARRAPLSEPDFARFTLLKDIPSDWASNYACATHIIRYPDAPDALAPLLTALMTDTLTDVVTVQLATDDIELIDAFKTKGFSVSKRNDTQGYCFMVYTARALRHIKH